MNFGEAILRELRELHAFDTETALAVLNGAEKRMREATDEPMDLDASLCPMRQCAMRESAKQTAITANQWKREAEVRYSRTEVETAVEMGRIIEAFLCGPHTEVDSMDLVNRAVEWARAFEAKYVGVEWGVDLEYFEAIDDFMEVALEPWSVNDDESGITVKPADFTELSRRNVAVNGKAWHLAKAAEECAELSLAILQYLTKNSPEAAILEEIGDVEIACANLRTIYSERVREIDESKARKIERIEARVAEQETAASGS